MNECERGGRGRDVRVEGEQTRSVSVWQQLRSWLETRVDEEERQRAAKARVEKVGGSTLANRRSKDRGRRW